MNAALRAFRETAWKHNRSLRARVLNAMADRFEARAEQLAQLLATENGKILPHARFETATVPPNLRFNAALVLTDFGRAAEVDEASLSIVIRQPVGVAGILRRGTRRSRLDPLSGAGTGRWLYHCCYPAGTDRTGERTDQRRDFRN